MFFADDNELHDYVPHTPDNADIEGGPAPEDGLDLAPPALTPRPRKSYKGQIPIDHNNSQGGY